MKYRTILIKTFGNEVKEGIKVVINSLGDIIKAIEDLTEKKRQKRSTDIKKSNNCLETGQKEALVI